MKVIASSLRKGNVVDMDGRLYVVLTAQNIHPGKGTPVTQLDMRRISDGVKVSERYRTTEQVERAFVEDREHTFLYQDGEGFHFMNPETYDQVAVPEDIIGDQAAYLQEGMAVMLSTHNGVPIAIELPQRVTLEIVETEPVDEGPDRVLLLQAREALERRAHPGAAAHHRRHPRRDHDRRTAPTWSGRRTERGAPPRRGRARPQPARRRSGSPPIPEAQGWARAYAGARGPLIDLSQAAPGTPPPAGVPRPPRRERRRRRRAPDTGRSPATRRSGRPMRPTVGALYGGERRGRTRWRSPPAATWPSSPP